MKEKASEHGPFVSEEAKADAARRREELHAESTPRGNSANMGAGSEEVPASHPTTGGKPANDNAASGECASDGCGDMLRAKQKDSLAIKIKPSIEFFARDVDNSGGKAQHGYTIFTYSDGKRLIVTGFPEENSMITGNLKGVVTEYIPENSRLGLFPKSDWHENKEPTSIKKWEFSSNSELDQYLSKAKDAINFVETGNNGKRFDYDLCGTDKCWGANSNTVQKIVYKEMGLAYEIPKGVNLPGIEGKFFEGPIDDFIKKYGEQGKY